MALQHAVNVEWMTLKFRWDGLAQALSLGDVRTKMGGQRGRFLQAPHMQSGGQMAGPMVCGSDLGEWSQTSHSYVPFPSASTGATLGLDFGAFLGPEVGKFATGDYSKKAPPQAAISCLSFFKVTRKADLDTGPRLL